MIVVDSRVWIDHFRAISTPKSTTLESELAAGAEIALTDVIYMELLLGARNETEVARLKPRIEQTAILRTHRLAEFELAAELFRRVRQVGQTIRQSTDCMIAAVCIREGLPLLHDDVDFDRIVAISELQVV